MSRTDTVERLREAVISLERSRRRERDLRGAQEGMLDVARVLATAEHPGGTFEALLAVLRELLPFQEAAILVRADDGSFRAAARTCEWLSALRLCPERMLARVVAGETVVMFDARLAPEWRAQPAAVQARARSVIHVPLRAGAEVVLLVCTHAEPARFEQRHVDIVKGLVPLAAQILQKLDLREVLTTREQERRARLAMLATIVDHIQAGVLLEDDRRRVAALNERLWTMFGGPGASGDLGGADAVVLTARLSLHAACPKAFVARTEQLVRERVLVSNEEISLADGRVFERDYVPIASADAGFIAHFWQYRVAATRRDKRRRSARASVGKAPRRPRANGSCPLANSPPRI